MTNELKKVENVEKEENKKEKLYNAILDYLEDDDAALVLKGNGEMSIFIPTAKKSDKETNASPSEMLIGMIAIMLSDKGDKAQKLFDFLLKETGFSKIEEELKKEMENE